MIADQTPGAASDIADLTDETFSRFPPLSQNRPEILLNPPGRLAGDRGPLRLVPAPRRQGFLDILRTQPNLSISKLINVEGYRLQELGYVPASSSQVA